MILLRSNEFTMSMWRKSSLLLILILISGIASSQPDHFGIFDIGRKKREINIVKTGPYFGLERGKYTNFEFGVERQWKKVKLREAETHAAHMGFNYNFRYNVLGYDLGYWFRPGRVSLTFGANLSFLNDFDENKFGFTPTIGYKIWRLHLQTGYKFLTSADFFDEHNTFFISLRLGWVTDRDIKLPK